jgi:hypothetical protein
VNRCEYSGKVANRNPVNPGRASSVLIRIAPPRAEKLNPPGNRPANFPCVTWN